jgi:hypothetical protein
VRLLETLAASMSVALENARLFDETQPAEGDRSGARPSSRSSIASSSGWRPSSTFQAIVDLVGDKLRALFNTGDIIIRWRDETTNLVQQLYVYEHGKRLFLPRPSTGPIPNLPRRLLKGAPVVLRNQA